MAPATTIFILYGLARSQGNGAELVGLVTGLVCGLVLLRGVSERTPPPRRIAIAVAITVGIALALAVPLRSMTDARPEIARVIEFEARTAEAYKAAVNQFRLGAINAEALAKVIERKIVPDLQEVLTRVTALKRVPPVQEALVMSAEMYLRLRDQSWRLRAEALHKSSMQNAAQGRRGGTRVTGGLRTPQGRVDGGRRGGSVTPVEFTRPTSTGLPPEPLGRPCLAGPHSAGLECSSVVVLTGTLVHVPRPGNPSSPRRKPKRTPELLVSCSFVTKPVPPGRARQSHPRGRDERRAARGVPVPGGLLERVRELQHAPLVAVAADDLHADRQPARGEPGRAPRSPDSP